MVGFVATGKAHCALAQEDGKREQAGGHQVAAIAAALGENTVTTITVEGTYGPTNVGNANVQGYFDASSVSANYESSNVQQQVKQQFDNTASSIAQTANYGNTFASSANYGSSQNTATKAGSTLVSTAGVGGVVYHDANQALNSNAVSSTAVNNVNAVQQDKQQYVSSISLTKAEQQQQLVSAVMNALVPSVETAVQRALMAMMSSSQQQQTTSSVSTQTTTISASQEQALVTKIIEVLTPSIASSVRKALAAAAFAAQQQAEQQAALIAAEQAAAEQAAADQAAFLLAQQQANFQAQQQATIQAQQPAAFQAQQQTTVTDNSAILVAQIIAALKPSIAISVSQALEESRFSSQQQSQAVQQQSVQQQSFQQSQSTSSGSLSSSSLTSIFGDGKAHNVKVETPQYAFEYNN